MILEDTLEQLCPIEEVPPTQPWIVIHTKSKCEKQLALHLVEHSIPYFLPCIETISQSRNRHLVPLFPNILFFAPLSQKEEKTAFQSGKIFSLLRPQSKASQRTLRCELALIASETAKRRTLERFILSDTKESELGIPVEIIAPHSCQGLRGRVLKQSQAADLFIIRFTFLGQLISMEIDPVFIRPV